MMMEKKDYVVKSQWEEDEEITSWGGLALAETLAHRTRLWSDCRRHLPRRTKIDAGYDTTSVISAMIHGLLSGAQGTYAAEPLRHDRALQELLGLEQGSPEEATVWRTLGRLAEQGGARALGVVQRRQVRRQIDKTSMAELKHHGFIPSWLDGTWLEVSPTSRFEGIKMFDGTAKVMLSALWVGPYLAGQSFAAPGEGELSASVRLVQPVWKEVIEPLGLGAKILFLADSLYGNDTALRRLEACRGARYIVGANTLAGVEAVAMEQPATQWKAVAPEELRPGWAESALCVHGYQGLDWETQRTAVTRRYRLEGEMFYRYRSVLTDLEAQDRRVAVMMKSQGLSFAQAIWALYDHKQGRENQFKDALIDLGLHHPPCQSLASNEVFYAVAALALNLAVGIRRIGLEAPRRSMRLWRLRREFFAIPARMARHAREIRARLYSTSNRLRQSWSAAMARLAAC